MRNEVGPELLFHASLDLGHAELVAERVNPFRLRQPRTDRNGRLTIRFSRLRACAVVCNSMMSYPVIAQLLHTSDKHWYH